MVYVRYVEPFGNQLRLVNDDGTTILAYPTNTERFILAQPVTPPDPDPDPNPGGAVFVLPFGYDTVSSEYGPREGGHSSVHQGIDFAPGAGAQINAAGAGTVEQSGWHNAFGNRMTIRHGMPGGLVLYTLYAHMQSSPLLGTGAGVAKGQHIGNVGNTGASFGAHLHWETHVNGLNWNNPGTHINPRIFMERYA